MKKCDCKNHKGKCVYLGTIEERIIEYHRKEREKYLYEYNKKNDLQKTEDTKRSDK